MGQGVGIIGIVFGRRLLEVLILWLRGCVRSVIRLMMRFAVIAIVDVSVLGRVIGGLDQRRVRQH